MCSTFEGLAVMMPWIFPGRKKMAVLVGQLRRISVVQSRKRCRFIRNPGRDPRIG
ncbi:hypothetical protein RchiOBHm_Chr7g0184761 [Rosa chinensis]|uniref:Uncharacterized protein n=1 Tax=Rosa chinensis TaxID=74649 RepID=A0A2P6P3J8_ROSCH|nr:hypothetical protein RchiOBHm_Chr7g0184761 [Rosa chinensis]